MSFASESFIDEVAAALKLDPVEFRLRHVKDARDAAVIKAAAEKSGWQSRSAPRRDQTGNKVSGRGIAYAQGPSPSYSFGIDNHFSVGDF
ncbi:MAG: hypothetical protein WBX25_15965 [Rhodomicrobium sp.]